MSAPTSSLEAGKTRLQAAVAPSGASFMAKASPPLRPVTYAAPLPSTAIPRAVVSVAFEAMKVE